MVRAVIGRDFTADRCRDNLLLDVVQRARPGRENRAGTVAVDRCGSTRSLRQCTGRILHGQYNKESTFAGSGINRRNHSGNLSDRGRDRSRLTGLDIFGIFRTKLYSKLHLAVVDHTADGLSCTYLLPYCKCA